MSVRIRLRRVGRKKQPYWRVVVIPRGAPRDGAYIEEIGFYNPRTRPAFLTLDLEKLDAWIQDGAEVSDSVKSLARKARKGGDDDVVFTRPGEEAPRLKTAKKPERRPKASTAAEVPEGMETTDEAGQPEAKAEEPEESEKPGEAEEAAEPEESGEAEEAVAEVTAAVEIAEPADETEATEAQEEAETESEAEGSATEVEAEADADEAEEEAESAEEAEEK